MRRMRQFVPSTMLALEDRVVMSVAAPSATRHPDHVRPVRLSSAEIAQSNASERNFNSSVSQTIHAGLPVAEQLTTTYNDGSTQTESLLKVPDAANNTVTSYETINLRDNRGIETVVDTQTFSGATQPFSGTDNTHNLTIPLPNGTTETQTYQEVINGNQTVVNGTTHEANGGIETWTSVKIKTGPKTTTTKTITKPNGSVEHQKIVTRKRGLLDSTTNTTTILPDGKVRKSSSATNVIRVQPPPS